MGERGGGEAEPAWCIYPKHFIRQLDFRKEKLDGEHSEIDILQSICAQSPPGKFPCATKSVLTPLEDHRVSGSHKWLLFYLFFFCVQNPPWSCLASLGQSQDSGRGLFTRRGRIIHVSTAVGHTWLYQSCAASDEREAKSAPWKNSEETRGDKTNQDDREEELYNLLLPCHFLRLASSSLFLPPGRMNDRISEEKFKLPLMSGVSC